MSLFCGREEGNQEYGFDGLHGGLKNGIRGWPELSYISRISKGTKIHMTLKRQRILKSQKVSNFYLNLSYQYLY